MFCPTCKGTGDLKSGQCPVCLGTGHFIAAHKDIESNERYTPSVYIAAVKRVFGGYIDLDTASCAQANETVGAKRYYTREENGLLMPWYGKVFCNPPFSRIHGSGSNGTFQQLFISKAINAHETGKTEEIILLLLGNCLFNGYFNPLWKYPVCLHTGTINFTHRDGTDSHYGFGIAFVYLGNNPCRFIEVFNAYGPIPNGVQFYG